MQDNCACCNDEISDQSKQYCINCEKRLNNYMNLKKVKELRYRIRRRRYIEWINRKPSKWRFISYVKWLKKIPPRL